MNILEKIKDYDTKSKNKININTRISYDLDFDKNKQNVLTLIQNNKKIIVCKYLYFGIYHKDTKLWIWSNSIPGVNKQNIRQINDIKKKYYLFENNNNVNIMFLYQFLTNDTILIQDNKYINLINKTLNLLSDSITVLNPIDRNNNIQFIAIKDILEKYI